MTPTKKPCKGFYEFYELSSHGKRECNYRHRKLLHSSVIAIISNSPVINVDYVLPPLWGHKNHHGFAYIYVLVHHEEECLKICIHVLLASASSMFCPFPSIASSFACDLGS